MTMPSFCRIQVHNVRHASNFMPCAACQRTLGLHTEWLTSRCPVDSCTRVSLCPSPPANCASALISVSHSEQCIVWLPCIFLGSCCGHRPWNALMRMPWRRPSLFSKCVAGMSSLGGEGRTAE